MSDIDDNEVNTKCMRPSMQYNANSEILSFIESCIESCREKGLGEMDNEEIFASGENDEAESRMEIEGEEALEVHIDPQDILSASHGTDPAGKDDADAVYMKNEPYSDDNDNQISIAEADIFEAPVSRDCTSDEINRLYCDFCDYSTHKKTSLKRHALSHSEEKPFECSQCSYKTNRKPSLKRHSLSHIKTKDFSCSQCSFSTKVKWNLVRHTMNHSSEKNLLCTLCSYATNNKAHLRRHMQAHLDKHIKCPHCEYRTHRKDHLQRHLVKHSSPLQLNCPDCDYVTVVKREMTMHALRHTISKTYACAQCPYQTDIKYHYHRHMWIHSDVRFRCVICDYKATRPDSLKKHLILKHNDTFHTEDDVEEYLQTSDERSLITLRDDLKSVSVDNVESTKEINDKFLLLKENRPVSLRSTLNRGSLPLVGSHFLSPNSAVGLADHILSALQTAQNDGSLSDLSENEISYNKGSSSDNDNGTSQVEISSSVSSSHHSSVADTVDSKSSVCTFSPDDEELLYMNYLGNKITAMASNCSSVGTEVESSSSNS